MRTTRAKCLEECSVTDDLVLQGGTTKCWAIADVGRALNFFLQRVDDFRSVIVALYERTPCTVDRPWTLVWYYDETVPADGVRLDQNEEVDVPLHNDPRAGAILHKAHVCVDSHRVLAD